MRHSRVRFDSDPRPKGRELEYVAVHEAALSGFRVAFAGVTRLSGSGV